MFYKEAMIQALSEAKSPFEATVQTLVEEALSHTRHTGQSLESIIYELLEGIDASHEHDAKMLVNGSDVILAALFAWMRGEMERSYRRYIMACHAHRETIDKHAAYLDEVLRTLVHYAEENRHPTLLAHEKSLKKSYAKRWGEIVEKFGIIQDHLTQKGSDAPGNTVFTVQL